MYTVTSKQQTFNCRTVRQLLEFLELFGISEPVNFRAKLKRPLKIRNFRIEKL
jgi:hypothetical protein